MSQSAHPVMDKHLQGTLCLLQFQPHLRWNWWEFWMFHLLCGTKKPLRWYRIFQKLDLGTSPKTNKKTTVELQQTTYNNTRFKKKCWDANPLPINSKHLGLLQLPTLRGFRSIGIEFSLRGPGPRHDSPRWKDHLPCIANYDCSTPRTLFFWKSEIPRNPKKSCRNRLVDDISWTSLKNMSGGMMRGFCWFLLHRLFRSWIPVFQDFLKW